VLEALRSCTAAAAPASAAAPAPAAAAADVAPAIESAGLSVFCTAPAASNASAAPAAAPAGTVCSKLPSKQHTVNVSSCMCNVAVTDIVPCNSEHAARDAGGGGGCMRGHVRELSATL
jgi:hypothetical protein